MKESSKLWYPPKHSCCLELSRTKQRVLGLTTSQYVDSHANHRATKFRSQLINLRYVLWYKSKENLINDQRIGKFFPIYGHLSHIQLKLKRLENDESRGKSDRGFVVFSTNQRVIVALSRCSQRPQALTIGAWP